MLLVQEDLSELGALPHEVANALNNLCLAEIIGEGKQKQHAKQQNCPH
jgi:hypothetical protein